MQSGQSYDSLRTRTFIGGDNQAAVGAQFAHAQLWLPGAATCVVLLRKIYAQGNLTNQSLQLRRNAAALGAGASASTGNKKLGLGVAQQAELRFTTNAALQGTLVSAGKVVFSSNQQPCVWDFGDDPIVLIPGNGLIVAEATVNLQLNVEFEWAERSV